VSALLLFIAGVIAGFCTSLVVNLLTPWVQSRLRFWTLRREAKSALEFVAGRTRLKAGGTTIDYVVLAMARSFEAPSIACFYEDTPHVLPPDLEALRRDFITDWDKRNTQGETHLPYNSPMYKLKRFDVGYRQILGGEEVPLLRLVFGATDYFTPLVTDLNVGDPIRDKYAARTDVTIEPVPEFATITGVTLNLITSDGLLLLTDRSPVVHSGAGRLHCSVAENLLRPIDSGQPARGPDPFRCGSRAVMEELGIEILPTEITFTAFGVDPVLCQYTFIGWARVRATSKEVE
jgi:hypothetical protein